MDVMYGLIKPIQEKYKFEFVFSTCIVDLAAIPPAVKEQLISCIGATEDLRRAICPVEYALG